MNPRIYLGGQIKKELRGDLAVVVNREGDTPFYSAFLVGQTSPEFFYLTDTPSLQDPLEAIYSGVSHEAGENLVKRINGHHVDGEFGLDGLDEYVVTPDLLKRYSQKQKPIVLVPTKSGYQVQAEV